MLWDWRLPDACVITSKLAIRECFLPYQKNTAERVLMSEITEDHVFEALKKVIDPDLHVNIVDLGLIYKVDIKPMEEKPDSSAIYVEMTFTSPMCPMGPQIVANVKDEVMGMDGVEDIDVKVVMTPPWTQDRMTEDAKDQLNIF